MLNSASRMVNTFCLKIGIMSFINGIETSKINKFIVYRNLCSPFIFLFSDAKNAAFIMFSWFMDILHIYCLRNISKVIPSIIKSISINMINNVFRKISCHIQPCKPVFSISCVFYSYFSSLKFNATISSNISNFNTSGKLNFPNEYPGFRIVIQNFFKLVLGNNRLAHIRSFITKLGSDAIELKLYSVAK